MQPTYSWSIQNDNLVVITAEPASALNVLYQHLVSEGICCTFSGSAISVEDHWLRLFRSCERYLGHWIINKDYGKQP